MKPLRCYSILLEQSLSYVKCCGSLSKGKKSLQNNTVLRINFKFVHFDHWYVDMVMYVDIAKQVLSCVFDQSQVFSPGTGNDDEYYQVRNQLRKPWVIVSQAYMQQP